jgi:hypothetical protein
MKFIAAKWRHRAAEIFGIDLRTLALFRFALGTLLAFYALNRMPDALAFYTDWGVLPRHWLLQTEDAWSRLSLYFINGDPWFAFLLLFATFLCAVALALGYRTRGAAILLFVLFASLANRNPIVLIGGDGLLACLLFWAMFLPLGARWSVDAALSRTPPPAAHAHVSWASAGLILQVLSVYFFSAILKDATDWWPDGTAVYYTMELIRPRLTEHDLRIDLAAMRSRHLFSVEWPRDQQKHGLAPVVLRLFDARFELSQGRWVIALEKFPSALRHCAIDEGGEMNAETAGGRGSGRAVDRDGADGHVRQHELDARCHRLWQGGFFRLCRLILWRLRHLQLGDLSLRLRRTAVLGYRLCNLLHSHAHGLGSRGLGSGHVHQLGFFRAFLVELRLELSDLLVEHVLSDARRSCSLVLGRRPCGVHDAGDREQHSTHQDHPGKGRGSAVERPGGPRFLQWDLVGPLLPDPGGRKHLRAPGAWSASGWAFQPQKTAAAIIYSWFSRSGALHVITPLPKPLGLFLMPESG